MFKPVNRYIQVILTSEEEDVAPGTILLPDDYQPENPRFQTGKVVNWSEDVRFAGMLSTGCQIVFDSKMLEEINVENIRISVVLDNYVIGLLP